MEISVINKQSDLRISRKSVVALVEEVMAYEEKDFNEIAIHFVNTKEICRLHLEFFDDPSPTDCMTFPIDDDILNDNRIMGDVFVCPKTGILYASSKIKDPYQEVTLYVIHGLLHLIGYEDLEKTERAKMRLAERRHLRHIGKLGLWLHP